MRPILIVGALKKETDYLVSKLEDCVQNRLGIYNVFEGKIDEYPVVILRTKVGVVNAASSITLAIEKYNPIYIFNEGTAGGITDEFHKKDIIIGEEVFNIMSALTPYKELGEGSNSTDWEYVSFREGVDEEKVTYKANKQLVDFLYSEKDKYENGNVYKGIVGSADVWNREKDKLKYLSEVHNVSCEDMEAISVYTIAQNYQIPVVAIKIMSDNELLGEEYEPEVASYLQEYFYEVLKDLIGKIK